MTSGTSLFTISTHHHPYRRTLATTDKNLAAVALSHSSKVLVQSIPPSYHCLSASHLHSPDYLVNRKKHPMPHLYPLRRRPLLLRASFLLSCSSSHRQSHCHSSLSTEFLPGLIHPAIQVAKPWAGHCPFPQSSGHCGGCVVGASFFGEIHQMVRSP